MIWAWLMLVAPIPAAWALDELLAWVYGGADSLDDGQVAA